MKNIRIASEEDKLKIEKKFYKDADASAAGSHESGINQLNLPILGNYFA